MKSILNHMEIITNIEIEKNNSNINLFNIFTQHHHQNLHNIYVLDSQ